MPQRGGDRQWRPRQSDAFFLELAAASDDDGYAGAKSGAPQRATSRRPKRVDAGMTRRGVDKSTLLQL